MLIVSRPGIPSTFAPIARCISLTNCLRGYVVCVGLGVGAGCGAGVAACPFEYTALGCYVEAESTKQAGRVASVIRNMKGIPVCLKVYTAEGKRDFISVDRVSMWEPYDTYIPNETYDENFKESFQ